MRSIKCVVVGDGAVGKTCLLTSYTVKRFSRPGALDYVPTIFENYTAQTRSGGEEVRLCLSDTSGQLDYDHLIPLAYPQTDVFLLCFSVVEPISFKNTRDKWHPAIRRQCPNASIILVGLKIDLRSDKAVVEDLREQKLRPITYQDGNRMAKDLGAAVYTECSSLTFSGVEDVFKHAVSSVIIPQANEEKKRRCSVA